MFTDKPDKAMKSELIYGNKSIREI